MPRISDAFLLAEKAKGAKAWLKFSNGVQIECRFAGGTDKFYKELDDVKDDEAFQTLIATEIMSDWKNLLSDDGSVMEFSVDNAVDLLKYVGVLGRVLDFCQNPDNFTTANLDEVGN